MPELQKILFLDIETVSQKPNWDQLDDRWKELWTTKSRFFTSQNPENSPSKMYEDRAAIFAEFGQIVCLSIGYFKDNSFRAKSFTGTETDILKEFFLLVDKYFPDPSKNGFCGHNIREFDIPYICRRAIIQRVPIPAVFQIAGKKPWETSHILDTLDLWKFGDVKHFSSLDLLAACLELPTSKSDISGKDVGKVFWEDQDIRRISKYCMQDVALTARVYLRLTGQAEPEQMQVEYLD